MAAADVLVRLDAHGALLDSVLETLASPFSASAGGAAVSLSRTVRLRDAVAAAAAASPQPLDKALERTLLHETARLGMVLLDAGYLRR
jgi:hypothetical protein